MGKNDKISSSRKRAIRVSNDEQDRRQRRRTRRVKAPPSIEMVQDTIPEYPERMGPNYPVGSLDEILFETLPMKGPAQAAVAINKLFRESHLDVETISLFLDCGGPGILLGAMNKWKQDGSVQLHCCQSILALIKNCPPSKSRRVAQCLLSGQALGLVLGALQRAPDDDLYLRMYALEAAAALTRCDGTDTSATILKRFIQVFDGVFVVANTMASFQENSSLQQDGAFLLKQMLDTGMVSEETMEQTASLAVRKIWLIEGKQWEGGESTAEDLVKSVLAA